LRVEARVSILRKQTKSVAAPTLPPSRPPVACHILPAPYENLPQIYLRPCYPRKNCTHLSVLFLVVQVPVPHQSSDFSRFPCIQRSVRHEKLQPTMASSIWIQRVPAIVVYNFLFFTLLHMRSFSTFSASAGIVSRREQRLLSQSRKVGKPRAAP
jgi:hypothetical protein